MERMNKGQAAVTDALFFLVIVMGLVSFLFFFSSQYGRTVGEYADSKYGSDYATSALKTVLYSSFARDGVEINSSKEIDFLVAAIKEDYADDESIEYFKKDLTFSAESVMQPVRNSFDYFLFIRVSKASAFVFPYFFISRKEFVSDFNGPFVLNVSSEIKNYYCSPANQTEIDNFIVFVGARGQAVSSITFPLAAEQSNTGIISLVLWQPKDFNESEPVFTNLHCELIPES
ncbi:MAG: hypothetical protein ABIJ74_04405 [archaeon]